MKNRMLAIAILMLVLLLIIVVAASWQIRLIGSHMAPFELVATQVDSLVENGECDKLGKIATTVIFACLDLSAGIKDIAMNVMAAWIFSMIYLSWLFYLAGRNSAQTDKSRLTKACAKPLGTNCDTNPENRASD